jgi:hypothetical protein
MKKFLLILFLLACCISLQTSAQQIPLEIMAGHKRTGADVLWFKKFSTTKNNPWLFFHRSRASTDYHNKTNFGVTNALSYNFKSGAGIVVATQFLQTGFVAKAGVQYFKLFKNASVFTWLVAGNNTLNNFSGDWFVLARWQPKLNEQWKWFLQAENFTSFDTKKNKSLTQRIRVGISRHHWQLGVAADYTESGINKLLVTNNIGSFVRKEF